MPEVKKVVLKTAQNCSKCRAVMEPGDVAVKDRREKEKYNKPLYYHTECKERQKHAS